MVMTVSLCAFIPFLAGFLYEGRWEAGWGWWVYVLASFTLAWMIPTLPTSEGEGTARQFRLQEWSLIAYSFIIGLGFNWVCVFLWFSRRYAFFSVPVVGVTGLIMALYAAIGLLLARLTNWRIALVFAIATCALGAIVLRLGLLR
jgi:hypothetical protein